MAKFQRGQAIERFLRAPRRELNARDFQAVTTRARKAIHVPLRHSFPNHVARKKVAALSHGVADRRGIQKFDRLLSNRARILKRDERAPAIIQQLDLLRPIYSKTTNYGHFGKEDPDITWEHKDKVDALRKAVSRSVSPVSTTALKKAAALVNTRLPASAVRPQVAA